MKLIVETIYQEGVCKFYLEVEQNGIVTLIGYDGKKLIEQPVENGTIQKIRPLFICPFFMKNSIMSAFINEANNINLHTDNENVIKGKLEAVEFHLSDMRDFAKKLLNNKIDEQK
jgi:hypothetical protein